MYSVPDKFSGGGKNNRMDEEKVQFQLVRSSRKTLGIQVLSPEKVLLRAPRNMPTAEIRRLVNENRPWIEKHLRMAEDREQKAAAVPPLTRAELEALARRALKELPPPNRYVGRKDRRLLWPRDHPKPAHPMGQLLRQRQSELQLSADALL